MSEKKKGKVGRFFKWLFLILLVILAALTVWNLFCGLSERKALHEASYGIKIDVGGKTMVADIKGEENDTTVILLPGLGSVSPVLEFKPLAEALAEKYRVITVEPFGYGLSDLAGTDRSLNAVVNELHSCVSSLDCEKYYLMAHSLSGVYALAWANQYPDEVEGFIGIDPSVPKQLEHSPLPISITALNKIAVYLTKAMNVTGIRRLMSVSDPRAILCADPSYPYTEEELKLFRLLTLHRENNKDICSEVNMIDPNLKSMRQVTFPDTVPVLMFVCSSNCEMMPEWEQLHKEIVTETTRSEHHKLQGEHYLHFDNKDNIVNTVFDWIPDSSAAAESAS